MFRKKSQRPSPLETTSPSAPVLPVFPSPTTNAFAIPGVEAAPASTWQGKARTVTSTSPPSFHKPSGFRSPSPPPSHLPRTPSYPGNRPSPPRASNTFSSDSHASVAYSIASLYPSPANLPLPPTLKAASLPNVRRSAKAPPTLNLVVVGAKRTGKTSFLRTLLGNVQLARGHGEADARERIAAFGGRGATRGMQELSVDVVERGEKIGLTVIDTVGLEIPLGSGRLGDELEVDRQLSTIMRTIEARFDETLKAENQVFHRSHRAHDSHVHLAIYLLHPESLNRPSSLHKNTSHPNLAHSMTNGSAENASEDELGMSEVDLRCIKRLTQRVNVLPVIARSDELTLSRLAALKTAIKRDLAAINISFGPFTSSALVQAETFFDEAEEDEVEQRLEPVRIIRTRSTSRLGRRGSRIRGSVVEEEYEEGEEEEESVDYGALLPFALVAPEDLGGPRFVREFRYGTVEVLNPEHSDFTPLRNALLGSQMKLLKESTRLDKYEPFRTHRLLARRATQAMPEEERASLIDDLLRI